MDPRLTYGSLLVPTVPAGAAAAAAVAAGLHHHQQHLHPYHSQLTSSVHHLAHQLHPFSQTSTVSHLSHHDSSASSSATSTPSAPTGTSSASSSSTTNSRHHNNANINPATGKVKRARQRVDAGEPRNSYASITNFSSTRSSAFHHPGKLSSSGLHGGRPSGIFKSNSLSSSSTASTPSSLSSSSSSSSTSSTSSSTSSSLSKSSGLGYALTPTAAVAAAAAAATATSTCSSCSFCSNNQSHHHHNRSSHHSSHPHLPSSSSSGGSGIPGGIGVHCNTDKMTSQYKENKINCNKQQNVDTNHIVTSLTSANSNVILGALGALGVGGTNNSNNSNLNSPAAIDNLINLNSMYHNGQTSSSTTTPTPYITNSKYSDEGRQLPFSSPPPQSTTTSSVPSSSLTSPIPPPTSTTTTGDDKISSSTPTNSSSYLSGSTSADGKQEEVGSGNSSSPSSSSSSAHLLRVILQKGRRGGSNNSNNEVNCDKSGSNCEPSTATTTDKTRRTGTSMGATSCTDDGEDDEEGEEDGEEDREDDETDSGRTITGSPTNNDNEGGDKVDDEEDDDDNMNNNNNGDDINDENNNKENKVVDELDVTYDDVDDDDDVKTSCSVDSEGEPDGDHFGSGRGSEKVDRYDLDTDEYNVNDNNNNMNLNSQGNQNNRKRVKSTTSTKSTPKNQISIAKSKSSTSPSSLSSPVNDDKSDSTLLSSNEITCKHDNNGSRSDSPLQLTSDTTNHEQSTSNTPKSTISDAKRARVENIVTNMLPRSNSISGQSSRSTSDDNQQQINSTSTPTPSATSKEPSTSSSTIVNGCKKRKLYHPQQSKSNGSLEDDEDDLLDEIVDDETLAGNEGEEDEDDEMNSSLIGLSSSSNLIDYEMSEINDLSIKSSATVKREISDKSELDSLLMKESTINSNHASMSSLMAKYETFIEPSASTNRSVNHNSNTNLPKDLSNHKSSTINSNKLNPFTGRSNMNKATGKESHRRHHHHHHHRQSFVDDGNGCADDYTDVGIGDDELIMNDEDDLLSSTRRSRRNATSSHHGQSVNRFSGLQDPAQLLNEARKLVYEQEKISKGHHSHHDSHHRQSRSSRKRSSLIPSSISSTSTMVNGLGTVITNESISNAPSPPLHYSDIEWLRDTLKAEMQANLIPSLNTIIDSVISRFWQRLAAAAAAAAANASANRSLVSSNQANLILPLREPDQRNSDLITTDSSKELTLLSQMLESKSPRTGHGKQSLESSNQQSQSNHNSNNVLRDSLCSQQQPQQRSSPSSHHQSHRQSGTPMGQIVGSNKSQLNGHHQLSHVFPSHHHHLHHPHAHPHHVHHHRGSSSSPSSFTLPTESAPVPKPPGPSPFAFPSGFKSNLLFPNFPSGLPGAAATSQTPPNLLHAASIAQHLNSFASVFQQQRQQLQQQQQQQEQQLLAQQQQQLQSSTSQQQQQQQQHSSDNVVGSNESAVTPSSTNVGRDQSTPTSNPSESINFLGGRNNQSSSAREGSPVDSEHRALGEMSPSDLASGGEQTEAMSLVVTPKRKRHKVTDSRITPRTVSRILNQDPLLANLIARGDLPSPPPSALNFGLSPYNGPPHIGPPTAPPPPLVPVSLPTSVAIPNPSLHSADLFGAPVFPFSDHARLIRESLFCQAAAAAAAASGVQGSASEIESGDRERDNKSNHDSPINDSQPSSSQQQQQQQQQQSPQREEQDQQQSQQQQQREEEILQRHHHHPHHHHHHQQQQQAAAVAAAAAAAAAQQHHHHQAATAAAIQNALAANHLAMLAQANRAAGGGDTASPESLSQFGGTRSENGADGSESLNDSTGFDTSTPLMSFCGSQLALQTTLTPMHLRKAKLMFFYVRYPSSNVLKTFFPDIKFNKNNTAQLVKWFSNFREFYYIQMEKYARQAISEGIKSGDEIHIHKESELLRVLNMHYNRSNHLDVPERFCYVVEQTLREFFKSIAAGKDNEQSWKKAIYKIISRLDDSVPEYFKSPNFLERLE